MRERHKTIFSKIVHSIGEKTLKLYAAKIANIIKITQTGYVICIQSLVIINANIRATPYALSLMTFAVTGKGEMTMVENISKDHISRTEVYNLLNAIGGCGANIETDPYTYGWDKAIDAAIEEIGKLPAVEYTPVKHGHWIQTNIFKCSECEYSFEPEGYLPFFNYCPCCGAKMDGG